MKIHSRFIMCAAAILSIAALSAAPALAQKKTAKACQEEWQANKAANQANKITEKESQNVRLKAPLLSRQWLHPRQLPRRRQLSRQQLSRKTPVKPSMRANAPAARIGRLTRPPVKFPPERSGRNIGVTATSARRLRECSGHCCFHHLQRACPLWVKSGLMHCSNTCPLRAKSGHAPYSITSSARCWSCDDTSRPSALAV